MKWAIIRESDLSGDSQVAIRQLLVAAFPQHADLFSRHSFWGSPPEYRLLGAEQIAGGGEGDDQLIAHLGFSCRVALVDEVPVMIAGIGAVAVHPAWQGRQIGQVMFARLAEYLRRDTRVDFGFLECREVVVGFYEKAGLRRVYQAVYSQDPDTGIWLHRYGPVMVLPVHKRFHEWPKGKVINLQGMPW